PVSHTRTLRGLPRPTPGPPSLPGDTTSDAAHKPSSAEAVDLDSLAAFLQQQADDHREDNSFLAQLLAYDLLSTLVEQSIAFDPSAVIAELKVDLRDARTQYDALQRRLDALANSAELIALLRKAVALSETQQSKIAETEKSKVAAVFAQADLHQQQVLARNAEIKALRQTFTDKDTAYSILQGVAAKHFEQQQKSARLLNSTNDQSLRHTLPTIENQRAVIVRQKQVIARQGYISMHGPTWRLP
ncbi:hypothetical protein L916_20377, partial [Phytophthora nicotianae]